MSKSSGRKDSVKEQGHLGDDESDLDSVKYWKSCKFHNKNLYESYEEKSTKKELPKGGGEDVIDYSKYDQEDFWVDKDSMDNLTNPSQFYDPNVEAKKCSPKFKHESSFLGADSHIKPKMKDSSQANYEDEKNVESSETTSRLFTFGKQIKHKVSDSEKRRQVKLINGVPERSENHTSSKPYGPSTSLSKDINNESFNTFYNISHTKSFIKSSTKLSSKQSTSLKNDSVDQAVEDLIGFANQVKEVNTHLKQKQKKLDRIINRESTLCHGKEEELCMDDRYATYNKPFLIPKPPVVKIESKKSTGTNPSLTFNRSSVNSSISLYLKDLRNMLNSHFKKKYNVDSNDRIIKLVSSKDLKKPAESSLNQRQLELEEELRNNGLDMLRTLLRSKLLS